jgi:hypothetical protein
MTVDDYARKFFASFIVEYQAALPEDMPLEKKRKATVAALSDLAAKLAAEAPKPEA